MKREALRRKLEGLSKAAILTALDQVLVLYPDEFYRDALRAELDAKWNERAAAAAKVREYLTAAAAGTPAAYKAYKKASAREAQISTRIARLIKMRNDSFEEGG